MNIAYNLENSVKKHPKKTALVFEETLYTFEQIDSRAGQYAYGLTKLGISKGDKVAIYLSNCPDFIFFYYAIQKLGGICVSLGSLLKTKDVEHILKDCQAKMVITNDELAANIVLENIPKLQYVVSPSGLHGTSYRDLQHEKYMSAIPCLKNDTAAILYTSATTGKSKGVMLSNHNILSNVIEAQRMVRAPQNSQHLCCVPLYHVFGQNVIMNASLALGSTITLEKRFSPDTTFRTIYDQKVEFFYGVPTIYELLLQNRDLKKQLSHVVYWFCAAAILKPETERKFSDWMGMPIFQGYGLTECSPCASYNHWHHHKFNSIGQPIRDVTMKIVAIDDIHCEMPDGELGEILIQGPNVMQGYFNNPQATQDTIVDGWLRSGDIGHRDSDGYFYIDDRVKDVIIPPGGFNVYPKHVEDAILQMPQVKEVAVVGEEDNGNELVKAYIVLKEGQKLNQQQIQEHCLQNISKYEIPKEIEFTEAIPKSPVGKVLKRILREKYDEK